jgi:hypothetical protein
VKYLIRSWREHGLTERGGVSERTIAEFEKRNNVHLPEDMRQMYLISDGMEPDEMEPKCLIRFWPLSELKEVRDEYGDRPEMAANYSDVFLFADHSLWAFAFGIRLSVESTEENGVVAVEGRVPRRVARSFSDFVEQVLGDSSGLFVSAPTSQ